MQLSVVGAAALAVWSKPIPWLPRAHCDGGSEPLRSAQLHAHRHDQTQEQRDPVLQSEEDLREFNVSWGEKRKNQIIFIGSGSSSGIPRPYCLMHPEDTSRGCIINRMAADPSIPSYANPNRRGNPSLLIRYGGVYANPLFSSCSCPIYYIQHLCQWQPTYHIYRWTDTKNGNAVKHIQVAEFENVHPPPP
ncbi:unnamed protein product [Chrysoparadoxa australica]